MRLNMSDLGKTFEEVGQNYFNSEMKPVTRVYADLEYLQDLRFGALLRSVTCQREMDYVHAMIGRYNNRYDQKTARYFPVLKKTDEELEQMLKTGIEKDRICFLAPWTSVYSHLLEVIDLYQQHNKRMLEKVPEMKLVINVSDVDYEEFDQYCLQPAILRRGIIKIQCHNIDEEFNTRMPKIEVRKFGVEFNSDFNDALDL